ncbi:guanylyl cyclase-related family protein [Striga asiatica]|uniref:Guanylyl cyclase-related family protein n=1 Tax=Striga asiatica TaxID=4170 RepID=A0A5A7RAK0_STRAF|nr:guanylyl cyclase-related family protein [Striga asiatica]
MILGSVTSARARDAARAGLVLAARACTCLLGALARNSVKITLLAKKDGIQSCLDRPSLSSSLSLKSYICSSYIEDQSSSIVDFRAITASASGIQSLLPSFTRYRTMWSLDLLMNKLLKTYEKNFEGLAGIQFNFVGAYHMQQSSSNDLHKSSVLSHFVDKFSVRFTYCTVTLGANPDFSVETFYKDQLPNDLVRVNMLFREARKAGICIECRSVSAENISDFILSGKYVAIALVDQYKLSQSKLEDVCVPDFYGGNPGYTGHYVVICGYDAVTHEFEIRDPASSMKHVKVSSWCLEQAHKSFGTDEDLLLISLEKGDQGNSLGFCPL